MTDQTPFIPPDGTNRIPPIGKRAARALVAEFARDNGPTSALLIGAAAGSVVLGAATDALQAEDRLTVVSDGRSTALRDHLALHGQWVAERVRVASSVDEVDPVDHIMLAEPLSGTAEQTRATLDSLVKLLNPGGVLSAMVPATTLPSGAADELERQSGMYGVGSDLVLRNLPPVRVHRLRYTVADHATATRLRPGYRPSSVPVTRSMNIDSNGVAVAGLALGLAVLTKAARPKSRLWMLPALAAVPVAAFFRDPQREIADSEDAIVAAADGRVLGVERVHDPRFSAAEEQPGAKDTDEYLRISVFLSVLDVHVNRSPVAGKVIDYIVEEGGYANASKPAAEHNVAAYTVLATPHGRVIVAQRTGLIARRIVQRAPVGSLLARGERFGLIRFGSRTDVYLPVNAAVALVAPGDRVSGGTTMIARWKTS